MPDRLQALLGLQPVPLRGLSRTTDRLSGPDVQGGSSLQKSVQAKCARDSHGYQNLERLPDLADHRRHGGSWLRPPERSGHRQ